MNQRILVCTVDAWSENVGSNTMSALLEGYDKEKIACLHIRAGRSDSHVCDKYFRIIEGRVLKSIFNRKIKTGESYILSINKEVNTEESKKEKELYRKYSGHCRGLLVLLREIVWKIGKWHTPELDNFLDDFMPEVVFFPIESYIHFNRINEYIINRCKPKNVLGYMWDDNFTYKQNSNDFLLKIHRFWLRKGVKQLVRQCNTVFAISPKMKRECDIEFGIESVILTKPVVYSSEPKVKQFTKPIKMLYTGKLIIGRAETLAQLVSIINELAVSDNEIKIQLYTNTELNEKMRAKLTKSGVCELKTFVPQSQVFEIQQNADVLLFVESLSGDNLLARLSFSTKLTDYFSAGKCILAIGNNELAPIEYLKEENAGIVCTNKEEIIKAINMLVNSPNIINDYALKAYECGHRNHDMRHISEIFNTALQLTGGGKIDICILYHEGVDAMPLCIAA